MDLKQKKIEFRNELEIRRIEIEKIFQKLNDKNISTAERKKLNFVYKH